MNIKKGWHCQPFLLCIIDEDYLDFLKRSLETSFQSKGEKRANKTIPVNQTVVHNKMTADKAGFSGQTSTPITKYQQDKKLPQACV